jgi:hypothetical protein
MMFTLDVIERDKSGQLVKTGTKDFGFAEHPLNEWVKRPKATVVRPPMNGALTVVDEEGWVCARAGSWVRLTVNKKGEKAKPIRISCDSVSPGALGYSWSQANDVYHQQRTGLFSSPYQDGHGWPVTPANFDQSLLVMAIRLLPKHTWLNHYDQFNEPNVRHPAIAQFKLDAIVWALFHGKNNASSLHPVSYKGKTYDIENQFFWTHPFLMRAVKDKPLPIIQQLKTARMRFVTNWLNDNLAFCSPDAQALAQGANLLVLDSLPDRKNASAKWHLDRWDAGWYQLRMWIKAESKKWQPALKALTEKHSKLGDRLRPLVYDLGCLPAERRY